MTSETETDDDDPLRGLRQAYADTFEQTDSRERCLHFLMAEWVDVTYAKRAAMLIGGYGTFAPTAVVLEKLEDIAQADPDARFAFGREQSVVLYVETQYPAPVTQILETTHAQEVARIHEDEFIGSVRETEDPHANCKHTAPPIPDGEWASPSWLKDDDDIGVAYIRAWWDS